MSLLLTSVPSLILINFLIPKIPKTDLGSSQIVESDVTLGIAKTRNVPHFYAHFIDQKFLILLQGCLCGVEVACWLHMLKVSGSNPNQIKSVFRIFGIKKLIKMRLGTDVFYYNIIAKTRRIIVLILTKLPTLCW